MVETNNIENLYYQTKVKKCKTTKKNMTSSAVETTNKNYIKIWTSFLHNHQSIIHYRNFFFAVVFLLPGAARFFLIEVELKQWGESSEIT